MTHELKRKQMIILLSELIEIKMNLGLEDQDKIDQEIGQLLEELNQM